jgi:peroxiredoxin Q/BCP
MSEIKIGAKAPKFKLLDKDGKSHGIGDGAAKDHTVLFFYPKDDTPGCTIESKEFSEALAEFEARGIRVIGISGGDNKTKAKFCAKHGLLVPLVSDTDFAVSQAYGVYGEKKFMGRSYMGITRATFIIDGKGVLVQIFDKVKPEGHAAEVLDWFMK